MSLIFEFPFWRCSTLCAFKISSRNSSSLSISLWIIWFFFVFFRKSLCIALMWRMCLIDREQLNVLSTQNHSVKQLIKVTFGLHRYVIYHFCASAHAIRHYHSSFGKTFFAGFGMPHFEKRYKKIFKLMILFFESKTFLNKLLFSLENWSHSWWTK